ncbi:hypothetical protein BGZ82_011444 [Podila clonocystis]|nr:hypothetical protein BGZ82_011444 [Podila clonocystis]
MKSTFIIAVLAATATVHAYQCPAAPAINQACRSVVVRPLVCNNPQVNVKECNAKQCIQSYIDNYSACQCRRSPNNFYEHSVNVEGLIRRCGMAALKNPYGSPSQYRPGQGTQTFVASSSVGGPVATRIFNGTTYYGGQTGVVSGTTRIVSATAIVNGTMILPGTTTWVSNTPGIIGGTSTRRVGNGGTRTAAPIVAPTEIPVSAESNKISGGAIAGIVLGTLAAAALAGLLGWCWRKKRNEHTAIYSHSAYENRGPTRTVVTEKIEPVVVKSNNNAATTTSANYAAPVVPTTGSTTYASTQSAPVGHNSTTYNTTTPVNNPYSTTTTSNGYNTQPRTGGVVSGVPDAVNRTTHAAHGTVNAVGSGANAVGTAIMMCRTPPMAHPTWLDMETNVLKRLAKEKVFYLEEKQRQQLRIDAMVAKDPENYDIKKQREVLDETLDMLPDVDRRKKTAQQELASLVTNINPDLKTSKEYEEAVQTLEAFE